MLMKALTSIHAHESSHKHVLVRALTGKTTLGKYASWVFLSTFGSYMVLLGSFGYFWVSLGSIGYYFVLLGTLKNYWGLLGICGYNWAILDTFG